MADLIEILKFFNRKERFFLLAQALDLPRSGQPNDPKFMLSKEFRRELGEIFEPEVPTDAFVAIDYHLDWIQASLVLAKSRQKHDATYPNEGRVIKGNQEDTDLLIAFKIDGQYHLVLVEAKGYSTWDSKQMRSKVKRLRKIFGEDGKQHPNVKPYFFLMSDRRPQRLNVEWLTWMLDKDETIPSHIKMQLPQRLKVERCDSDGNSNKEGEFFHCPRAE